MSYQIERLEHHPALLIKFNQDFVVPNDILAYMIEAKVILEQEPEPISILLDLTDYNLSLDNLLHGTKISMKPENNIAKQVNVKQIIAITDSKIIVRSLDGFMSLGLGDNIIGVSSLDEALEKLS
ncbi:MAG: hypothetical protein Phog2KO_17280 [Phototrophicaceae bacterium]